MRIPHDSYILVADGAKMLFFRNQGDAENPNLTVIAAEQQADLYDREIKTDLAGQKPGSPGSGAGFTAGETDFHKQAEDRFAAKKGAFFKPVTPNPFSDLGDNWKSYNQTYDPKGDVSEEQKRRVIEFSKFASTASDSDFAAKIGDYIDLDNFTRYLAITTWLTDLDGILGPGQNYYVYLHPKTQKFLFIPWDQDQPFGQFPRGTQEQRENLSIHKPWTGENRFLERVYKTESFKTAYLTRLAEFNKSIFEPERIHRQADELAGVLRAPIQEESPERLSEFDKAVAGQKLTIVMGPGFQGGTAVTPIKPFVKARAKSVADQLEGRSKGETINPGFGR